MTYLDVNKACVNLFLDNWTETQIELEGVTLKVNDLDEFTRLQVFNDDSSNFSHGAEPRRLLTGSLSIEIYIRRGQGIGRQLKLVDDCVGIFNNVKLANGLKFDSCEVLDHGQMIAGETVVDPNWLAKTVMTRFRAPI